MPRWHLRTRAWSASAVYAGAGLACAAVLVRAAPAAAHAPPYGIALLFSNEEAATEPTVLTNRGLIFNQAGELSLRCNAAYGAGTAENTAGFQEPYTARFVVRSFAGVFASSDNACSFTRAESLTGDPIGAFATDTALSRVLVSSLNYGAPAGVMVSTDKARTFATLSMVAASSVINTMMIAPSDPKRVYAGGSRFDTLQMKLLNTWLVSEDGGATFRTEDVMYPRTPLGVHPTNKDVVFVADEVDELAPETHVLRSSDGGRVFTSVLDTTTALSFASNADASHMWFGAGLGRDDTKRGGLFESRDQGVTITPTHDEVNAATCLVQRGKRLWLCGNVEPNEGGIWYSDDQGANFVEYFTFDDVKEEVVCSGEAQAADGGVCAQLWSDWVYEQTGGGLYLDAGVLTDAGVAGEVDSGVQPDPSVGVPLDAGRTAAVDAAAEPDTKNSGGGCSVSAHAASSNGAWCGLLLASLGLRRRFGVRRRRPS